MNNNNAGLAASSIAKSYCKAWTVDQDEVFMHNVSTMKPFLPAQGHGPNKGLTVEEKWKVVLKSCLKHESFQEMEVKPEGWQACQYHFSKVLIPRMEGELTKNGGEVEDLPEYLKQVRECVNAKNKLRDETAAAAAAKTTLKESLDLFEISARKKSDVNDFMGQDGSAAAAIAKGSSSSSTNGSGGGKAAKKSPTTVIHLEDDDNLGGEGSSEDDGVPKKKKRQRTRATSPMSPGDNDLMSRDDWLVMFQPTEAELAKTKAETKRIEVDTRKANAEADALELDNEERRLALEERKLALEEKKREMRLSATRRVRIGASKANSEDSETNQE